MKKQITFKNYVPSNEQAIITKAVTNLLDVAQKHTVAYTLLNKPLEVLYSNIEGYAMIQPLIDGRGGIAGHRLYINSNYIFNDRILEKLVAHETLHTLSERNILKHESLLFKSIALDYEVKHNLKIDFLTESDIEYIERGCRI